MMMSVIVCGSRDWATHEPIVSTLEKARAKHLSGLTIIEGGARGADRFAAEWAKRVRGVAWVPMPARWTEHHPLWCPGAWCVERRSCLGAGPRRNQAMLDALLKTLPGDIHVLAFKAGFRWKLDKGGTEDMVRRALDAGVAAHVYDPAEGWADAQRKTM